MKVIVNEAISFYQDQFTGGRQDRSFSLVDLVPVFIKEEDNEALNKDPINKQIKRVVFVLNRYSDSGFDGLIGHFYQVCWDFIEVDIVGVVRVSSKR